MQWVLGQDELGGTWGSNKKDGSYQSQAFFFFFLPPKHLYSQRNNADTAPTAAKLLSPQFIMSPILYFLMKSAKAKKFIKNLVATEIALLLLSKAYERSMRSA